MFRNFIKYYKKRNRKDEKSESQFIFKTFFSKKFLNLNKYFCLYYLNP